MKRFWPSTWPSSPSRCTNAARRLGLLDGVPDSICPIFAFLTDRCGRAASGQTAAAPPRIVMNSRRCMCHLRTGFVQFLNTTTLRSVSEREKAHSSLDFDQTQCPSRVNLVGLTAYRRLLLDPYKQTSLPSAGMSQRCQFL